jgi:hypothetical protein
VWIRLLPHWLQRSRRPASGTTIVAGSASTLTSAMCPQVSHVAITLQTPFWRMFASVMGGPNILLTRQGDRTEREPWQLLRLSPRALPALDWRRYLRRLEEGTRVCFSGSLASIGIGTSN